MRDNILLYGEVVMATSNKKASRKISDLLKKGELRKIAPKIYTSNMKDSAEEIIRRNFFFILGQLYPRAIISHRSAFELKPTENGDFYLTYSYTKNINLPGVKIHLIKGFQATKYDMNFGELFISSRERRVLENLQLSRKRNSSSKCIPRSSIENHLEHMLQISGEKGINNFRDKSRLIAGELLMEEEFEILNALIGALLLTKPSKILTSPSAIARVQGEPFDADRIRLFTTLFETLHNETFSNIEEPNQEKLAYRNFAFFESYFSNYIEGTKFEIEEAIKVIENGKPLPTRREDSHDILGTFQIVADRREMKRTPTSSEDLIEILKDRHLRMMAFRKSVNPGVFKTMNNRASETHFVDANLVVGTLKKGFEFYRALEHPFARAIYISFMISEVHPFNDGNGRISRIMMNSELVEAEQSKIIIPTVFREDYLNALRRLTRKADPSVLIRALKRVRNFSAKIQGVDFELMLKYLESCNAFKDEDGYILRF